MAPSPTSIIRQSKFVKKSPHRMWNLILSTQAAESFHAKFLTPGPIIMTGKSKTVISFYFASWRALYLEPICRLQLSCTLFHSYTSSKTQLCTGHFTAVGEGALCFFLNSFAFLSSNAGFKSNLIIVNKLSTQKAKKLPREVVPHRCDIHQDFVKARCNMMWGCNNQHAAIVTPEDLPQILLAHHTLDPHSQLQNSSTCTTSHHRKTKLSLEAQRCAYCSLRQNICHTLAKDSMDSHGIRQGPAYQIPKFCTGLVNNMRN